MRTKLSSEYNLKYKFPHLARQWHSTKNGDLSPDQVTPYSNKKVWWECTKGHEWSAKISKRTIGNGCPYCNSHFTSPDHNFAVIFPELARQWHPTKNGDLKPNNFLPGSEKLIWWICSEGHEWKTKINKRSEGCSCPYCFGLFASPQHNLAIYFPELAAQWHPTKNDELKPEQVAPHSGKKVWWICSEGHEWKSRIFSRSAGKRKNKLVGCPGCYKWWKSCS